MLYDSPPENRAPRPVWPIVVMLAMFLFCCTGSVGLIAWGIVGLVEVAQQDPDPARTGTTPGAITKLRTTASKGGNRSTPERDPPGKGDK